MITATIATVIVLLEREAAQHDRLADAWRSMAEGSHDPAGCTAQAIYCEGIAQGKSAAALRLKMALEPANQRTRRPRRTREPSGPG